MPNPKKLEGGISPQGLAALTNENFLLRVAQVSVPALEGMIKIVMTFPKEKTKKHDLPRNNR